MMRNVSCPVRRGADGKGPGHRNLASRLPYNLIAQLKGGVKALAMPVGDLVSNGAYVVMASLAWSLKAWAALLLPEQGRWPERPRAEKRWLLRMEFNTFCVAMIQVPCQIVRTAGRMVYRLLAWNPWQGVFLRLVDRLHGRRLC
jgi:hypothetical protein